MNSPTPQDKLYEIWEREPGFGVRLLGMARAEWTETDEALARTSLYRSGPTISIAIAHFYAPCVVRESKEQ